VDCGNERDANGEKDMDVFRRRTGDEVGVPVDPSYKSRTKVGV